MNLLKSIYYNCISALPLGFIKTISPPSSLFPYHHIVSNEIVPHIKYLYNYKNVDQFNNDLDVLLKNFKPITPGELIDYISTNKQLPKNTFLLTFDDGFREIYDVVAPILEAKGIPAIFFINPAFIDNKKLFYRSKSSLLIHELLTNKNNKAFLSSFSLVLNSSDLSLEELISRIKKLNHTDEEIMDNLAQKISLSFEDYLQNKKPFLTTQQLISLHKRGFTIGAHSWDHPYYDQLNLSDQIDETIRSTNFVKDKISSEKVTFSFPYSDAGLSQTLFDELKKKGIDLMFGIQNQKDELNNNMVHRFNAERPEVSFSTQLKGMLLFMAIQKKFGKNNVVRN